jgi:hypothetical protein
MPDVRPKQVYKLSDHQKVTVEEVSGQTVSGTLADSRVGSVAVWVGSPADLENLELLSDAPAK